MQSLGCRAEKLLESIFLLAVGGTLMGTVIWGLPGRLEPDIRVLGLRRGPADTHGTALLDPSSFQATRKSNLTII